MISVGKKLALDFPVKAVRDGQVISTSFVALLDRPAIVSVYMRNNTGGCDKQNDSLAKHADEFKRAGYTLIAVSRDTAGSHLKYAAKKKISYVLVSDPEDLFAKATDSIIEKKMYGRTFFGPSRSAYVLDADGAVRAIAEKVDTADHAAQLRKLIQK